MYQSCLLNLVFDSDLLQDFFKSLFMMLANSWTLVTFSPAGIKELDFRTFVWKIWFCDFSLKICHWGSLHFNPLNNFFFLVSWNKVVMVSSFQVITQLTFSCSKSTIKALEKDVKYICSKLTIKIPERRQWRVFIVSFEHSSHLFLVFLLLALNK